MTEGAANVYVIYNTRWIILAACCVVALSNAMQWMSYNVIPEQSKRFYCSPQRRSSSCSVPFITNQIFQVTAGVTGLLGMYITDKFGIRVSLTSSAVVNLIGCFLRLMSSHPWIESYMMRQTLLYSGSVIAASAQAFFLVLPAKIAECWFAEDQRTLANVLSFISNPFGVAIGTLLPMYYFGTSLEHVNLVNKYSFLLFHYNSIMFFLSFLGFVLTLFLKRSLPPTPPGTSLAHLNMAPPFIKSLSYCLTNTQFLIQMFVFSMGFALFWTYMMILPEILITKGYMITPYVMSIAAIFGTGFSIYMGKLADQTKKLKEIIKLLSVGVFVSAAANRLFLLTERTSFLDDVVLIIFVTALGAFSIPQFPIGSELGVETTFPILEATSSGLLVLAGHCGMFILYAIAEFCKFTNLIYSYESTQVAGNWQFVLDIWLAFSLATAVVAVFAVNPRYQRMEHEKTQSPI